MERTSKSELAGLLGAHRKLGLVGWKLIRFQSLRFHDRIHSNVDEAVLLIWDSIAGSYINGKNIFCKPRSFGLLISLQKPETDHLNVILDL